MNHNVIGRIGASSQFLGKLWRLAAPTGGTGRWPTSPCWASASGCRSGGSPAACWRSSCLLNIVIVWILKLANDWNARFFNALQEKNVDAFWVELRYFVFIAVGFILIAVYRLWFRQMLQIRWRRWLTEVYYGAWLQDRTYYRMELVNRGTDNPEQRIQEDCDAFTGQALAIVLGLISEVLTLVTFTVVLWQLSGSITVPIFGGIEVPGYMMWVAIVYAGVGSWITYRIGRPLVRVNFELQRFNADFRYRMVRLRENAESIALYNGEQDEARQLGGAFRTHLRRLVGLHALQQAADLVHRLLRPGRRRLPAGGGLAALLRRRDPARRADPDGRRLRPGAGGAVLVHRDLLHPRRLEGDDRPAHHLRRGDGGDQGGAGRRSTPSTSGRPATG